MSTIDITGNLGADARINTAGGSLVAGFTVAYTPRKPQGDDWVDAGPTLWFDVSAWDELADKYGDDLRKGTRVRVIGKLGSREHEGKTYMTVRAEMLKVIAPKSQPRTSSTHAAASQGYAPADPWATAPASDGAPF